MQIFIYSDESGVFDKVHNKYFAFGGLIYLSKEAKDIASRKYKHAESTIMKNYHPGQELKACLISNRDKGKLYRSLNNDYQFGVVIKQDEVLDSIMHNKKNKQRYLDYVYGIAVKRALERMVEEKIIIPEEVSGLFFSLDEHTTATNGLYELKELLSGMFKDGKHDADWDMFCPPLFPNVHTLTVNYCNSKKKTLVRAADIVANHIYHRAVSQDCLAFESDKITVIKQP